MCQKHDDQPVTQAITLTRYVCKYWWDRGLEGELILHPSLEAAEIDSRHQTCGIVEVQVTLTKVVRVSDEEAMGPPEYVDQDLEEEFARFLDDWARELNEEESSQPP